MDHVEVVAECEVLVDDLDAERAGVLGAVQVHHVALEPDLAGVEGVDAGDALDQGALAGAVVTDEGGDLAGVDLEVDTVQHLHRAEALVDSREGQKWCAARGGALLLCCGDGHRFSVRSCEQRWLPARGLAATAGGRSPARAHLTPYFSQAVFRSAVVQSLAAVVKPSETTSLTLSA